MAGMSTMTMRKEPARTSSITARRLRAAAPDPASTVALMPAVVASTAAGGAISPVTPASARANSSVLLVPLPLSLLMSPVPAISDAETTAREAHG